MSLLPYLLDDPSVMRPSALMDQHFGSVLDADDLLQPFTVPRYLSRTPAGYLRNWIPPTNQDSGSVVSYGKDKFQANLDVQQFKPEEITVKVTGDHTVTIEGKHEERPDEHGHIYRHFVRRYVLPKQYDVGRLEPKLSSDGVLSICAPKIEDKHEGKHVPITHTGKPLKHVEKKPIEKKK